MIVVLGGTTEANHLLNKIVKLNHPITISTAYKFAEKFIPYHPLIQHINGKLDLEDLHKLIKSNGAKVVIDATHPYATEISDKAKKACNKAGVKYIRLSRPPSNNYDEASELYRVNSYEEAADLCCSLGKVIFLAIGSSNAHLFRRHSECAGRKFYVRILPDVASIERCIAAGFGEDEIITGIGPFSFEENRDTWSRLSVDVVVTKESGVHGGFPEKVRAASDLGIKVVVVNRPVDEECVIENIDKVVDIVKRILAG
ncbi:MAG: precorrin-6A reductase [Firmicutes bacterium]|nr:precorrin-6A reductase [Bacillota bacterium]